MTRFSLPRLFGAIPGRPVKPDCPPGVRIYCIGDIHGRSDLLERMHAAILADAEDYTGRKTVIYLGDYIDRGDHSREVIDLLLDQPLPAFESIHLRGNHEQTLLDFLHDPGIAQLWFNYGGLQTLLSYGVRYAKIPTRLEELQALQKALTTAIPRRHLDFFAGTRMCHTAGSYYFVHAGINPRRKLERQHPEDQLWIRDEFIDSSRRFDKIIVHGHTISEQPDFQANRIGIDTGAYMSGKLSCLVLENGNQRIIQAHG